ncbi:hypothetical protein A9Q99_10575 [Gammaproteobacteria bacterium 45_16_T64]|nr:hypothetical protein A9Q99_10575 [Gammaproteobacteria bacterium 45_16_T64]
MYVSALDRPWLETPYLMQGFFINSLEDIDKLRSLCEYVYVDVERQRGSAAVSSVGRMSDSSRQASPFTTSQNSVTSLISEGRTKKAQQKLERMFPNRSLLAYKDEQNAKVEMETARQVCLDLNHCVKNLIDDVSHGHSIDISTIKGSVSPMIDSVLRNPDACMWLARLKNKDSYTYKHSMGASIWAVALGRQIGLPKIDLMILATGTLLCDIGKVRLPEELLSKTGALSDEEFAQFRSHVELSLSIIDDAGNVNPKVRQLVAYHHERHDGSGYPNEIRGSGIPVLSRIAAIADCYDAMTSERVYAKAISPSVAVRKLFEWRGKAFQAELVEEFIQAVGLYPAGTLVELNSGVVAIVISESRTRRLRPKVLLLTDEDKILRTKFTSLDMMEDETCIEDGLFIEQSLSPGSYGIDPESIYY